MVGKQVVKPVCWSTASVFDSELTLMYAVLLALLLAGGVAIYAAYRWYRTLKQPAPTSSEDLAELARALQEQGGLSLVYRYTCVMRTERKEDARGERQ
jgi:hypothetical protein